jgi:hypothetical protein
MPLSVPGVLVASSGVPIVASLRVAVVLRGKLETWVPGLKSVARDGFYKHRDGAITDMPDDELYAYDPLFSN